MHSVYIYNLRMSLSVRSSGSFSRQSRTTSRTIKDWKNIKNKQLVGEKAHCDSFSLCFDLDVEIEVHTSIFLSVLTRQD